MSLSSIREQDARLLILRTLDASAKNGQPPMLTAMQLDRVLTGHGYMDPQEWLYKQLDFLAQMGAVQVSDAEFGRSVLLLDAGRNHLAMSPSLPGVTTLSLSEVGARLIAEQMKSR
ncbi:hypothetical protein [Methylocystis sp. S23]